MTNAHFVELDLLLSQYLGLRRAAGARRQRLLADLSAHGFVTLNAGARPEEEVLEARMTLLGRKMLRVWRTRVVRANSGADLGVEIAHRKTLRLFGGDRKM